MVTYNLAPKYVLNSLLGAFEELTDYRIIFIFHEKTKKILNVTNNIKFIKWAPQFDILSHNKTKLFISHGGLKR